MAEAQSFYLVRFLLPYLVMGVLFGGYIYIRYTNLSSSKILIAALVQMLVAYVLLKMMYLVLELTGLLYYYFSLFSGLFLFDGLISPIFIIAQILSLLFVSVGVHVLCKDKK